MASSDHEPPLEMGGVLLERGARIGSYVFMRQIGSGGMALVLLAKDPSGKRVALKVLRQSRLATGQEGFRREFRALSRIRHPHVIHVEAYGDLHGHPYIAMEYVDGPSLHDLIRSFGSWNPRQRWQRITEIVIDLCRALSAIHRRGLVHRDLKPANVLVVRETGHCKLTDFGIVKDLEPRDEHGEPKTLVGTWAYSSPEQIHNEPIDHRSDLYSLGVILFTMLTGKRPFTADDVEGYREQHRNRLAPSPREVNRDIPPHLDEICHRLLQKAPRDRYQSAREILYRLEAEDHAPPTSDDGWEPPLVGRVLEVEALTDAVAGLTASRGGVVILEGEDGVGKSQLLSVAADRARALGIPAHRRGFHRDAPALSEMLQIVHEVLQDLGEAAPAHLHEDLEAWAQGARRVSALEPGASDDGARAPDAPHSVYDAARGALSLALDEAPRVLLLDDLHEASPRDVDLLAHLVRQLLHSENLPLLVIATLRPEASAAADGFAAGEGLGPLDPREISVGTLAREDLAEILFRMVGDTAGSRQLAQRLHRETEGNPYFVTEFLRSLMASEVLRPRRGTQSDVVPPYELTISGEEVVDEHLGIPPGVRQMMRAQLASITREDRRVVEVLAVQAGIGADVLCDVLDDEASAIEASLERLRAAGIVRGGAGGQSLRHRQFADVVYRDLDAERRALLHRRTAGAIELLHANQPGVLEIVGEHYRRAGMAGRAYGYLVAAAKRLADRSLPQEAWDLTERAGTLEDSAQADLPAARFRSFRRDNLTVRATVLYNRAAWDDAERTWQVVLGLAEAEQEPRAACEARLRLATVRRRQGHHNDARALAEKALTDSRALQFPEGEAEALHCMAALAWSHGDLQQCEALAREGLLVAGGSPLADRRAELLVALTAAQALQGNLAEATAGLTEAEGIFRELRMKRPRCVALANIAELLIVQGQPLEARQRAHVAVTLSEELDFRLGSVAGRRAMGVAALDLGLYDEAASSLRQALDQAVDIDLPEEVVACQAGLARLALEQGDPQAAATCAREGIAVVERRDPERYRPLLEALLGRALGPQDRTSARPHLERAAQALSELPLPRRTQVQLELAWAHLGCRERPRAQELAEIVVRMAGARGFRLLAIEARALMARLTDGDERDTHRSVGVQQLEDFKAGLSSDMLRAFRERPFMAYIAEAS